MKYKQAWFFLVFLIIAFSYQSTYAQKSGSAKWFYTISKESVKIGDELDIYFRVELDSNWFIYAINQETFLVPPAMVYFNLDNCTLNGKLKSLSAATIYNEKAQKNTNVYMGMGGGFKQRIKITGERPVIKVSISYTLCSLETGEYFFTDKDFRIKLD
jgi:thiol:disulfide interchange protein DsbD